jgi:hypothetical protein
MTDVAMVVTGKTWTNGGYTLNLGVDYDEDTDWKPDGTTATASLNIVVSSTEAAAYSFGQKVQVTMTPGAMSSLVDEDADDVAARDEETERKDGGEPDGS